MSGKRSGRLAKRETLTKVRGKEKGARRRAGGKGKMKREGEGKKGRERERKGGRRRKKMQGRWE